MRTVLALPAVDAVSEAECDSPEHVPEHTSPYTAAMAVYADLVRYRELFANLFRRDFQAKYRGSVLGVVWSLVNPLALMARLPASSSGCSGKATTIPHYPLYLLSGLACWVFFATSLQTGARARWSTAPS